MPIRRSPTFSQSTLRAHRAAQEVVYFTEVCHKALERISAPNGNTFKLHSCRLRTASSFGTGPTGRAVLLAAACHNATCKTKMCISLLKIASAVVDARVDGRAEAANRLTTAKIDAQLAAHMGPRPREPRESVTAPYAEGNKQPNPPNPHYGAGAPTPGRGAGKEKEKEKVAHLRREKAAHSRLEKVKRQCSAQTASAPPTVRAFTATYAPRLLLMSAVSTRMAPAPTRNNNSTNTTEASPSGTPPPLALSCAPKGV